MPRRAVRRVRGGAAALAAPDAPAGPAAAAAGIQWRRGPPRPSRLGRPRLPPGIGRHAPLPGARDRPPTSGCSTAVGPRTGCTPTPGGSCGSSREFVNGFGALAEVGPAVSVFGSARTRPRRPRLRARPGRSGGPSSRPATPSSPGAGRERWRPPTAGPSTPAARRSGSASSCPSRQGSTSTSTSASTSATSSRARRCSSSTPQGFVVLPGGFGTLDELFEAVTLVQTQKVTSFPIVLLGSRLLGRPAALAARDGRGRLARSREPTSTCSRSPTTSTRRSRRSSPPTPPSRGRRRRRRRGRTRSRAARHRRIAPWSRSSSSRSAPSPSSRWCSASRAGGCPPTPSPNRSARPPTPGCPRSRRRRTWMPCASTPRCRATGWTRSTARLEELRAQLAEREQVLDGLGGRRPEREGG